MASLGVVLIILPFVVISARAFLHSRPFVLNPSPYLPSQTGTIQSFSLAIRNIIKDNQLSDGGAAKLVIGEKIAGALSEPITVAVIMGESIAPLQLGIFGEKGTTPRLSKRLEEKGNLRYFPKIGISAGVSTLGSVPLFIRVAHNPVAAFRRKNTIFEIAKQSGFSVGYYSAQNIKPLQIGGGLSFIDQLETKENWLEAYDQKQDAIILDQMDKSPISGDRQFVFIHQRTNHSPYFCDESTSIDFSKSKRLARYRKGLLCYDRNLDELLTRLEKKPGALYIFIVADHNELMGANGKWGHSHLHIQTALVPMVLATNRPDSDVAKAFARLEMPSAFQFMRLVVQALGRKTSLDRPSNKIFINGVIAYGRRGYLEIEKTEDVTRYKQTLVDPASNYRRSKEVTVTGLKKGLEYMKRYDNQQ
jgi:glucan phosphoethanolaminetransferase (alkaline phosphatase superfamily)